MTLIVHASCLHVCVQKLRGMRTTEVQNMAVHEMCEGKKHCVTFASNQFCNALHCLIADIQHPMFESYEQVPS